MVADRGWGTFPPSVGWQATADTLAPVCFTRMPGGNFDVIGVYLSIFRSQRSVTVGCDGRQAMHVLGK